jgi:hypothetical protein
MKTKQSLDWKLWELEIKSFNKYFFIKITYIFGYKRNEMIHKKAVHDNDEHKPIETHLCKYYDA